MPETPKIRNRFSSLVKTMLRLKPIILVLIVSGLLLIRIVAQVTTHRGNLLVIDMYSSEINSADTVGNWEKAVYSQYGFNEYYEEVFKVENNTFFVLTLDSYNRNWEWGNFTEKFLQFNSFSTQTRILHYYHWFDIMEPYLYFDVHLSYVKNGTWVLHGTLGHTFVQNNDSLFVEMFPEIGDLVHIAGDIGEKSLIAEVLYQSGINHFGYFLVDLSESPNLKDKQKIEIEPEQNEFTFEITEIQKLKDNIYTILSDDYRFRIADFINIDNKPKLKILKTYEGYSTENAVRIGAELFSIENGRINV